MILQLVDKHGDEYELEVESLLAVDGRPYDPESDPEILSQLNYLAGQVQSLQAAVFGIRQESSNG